MSALIYVGTSIPSFYHEARLEPEHQVRRQWTREWWDLAMERDRLVTSAAVIAVFRLSPEPKRSDGLALLAPLQLLAMPVEVDDMTGAYIAHKVMPRDATGDARHLAVATFHRCDILVTWNCRHIANVNKQTHIRSINAALGFPTPALVTPLELLET